MNLENLEVRKDEETATIAINRPAVLNALNTKTLQEIEEALCEIEVDESIRVVVITGSGERSFCSGGDIKELQGMDQGKALERTRIAQRVFNFIDSFPKPVIASIDGFCIGGGCELALACDIRVATKSSKIGLTEVGFGGIPSWGGTQRLPRLIGKSRAMELILVGCVIDADAALQIGLINKVAKDKEDLAIETKRLVEEIARNSALALKYAKWAVNKSFEIDLMHGLDYEVMYSSLISQTGENIKRVRMFVSQRKTAESESKSSSKSGS